jgi:hypothetical protein
MNLTPEQKAKEFFNKYWNLLAIHNVFHRRLFTKQCALIAVDEILNAGKDVDEFAESYWQEVKQEIEKL